MVIISLSLYDVNMLYDVYGKKRGLTHL